MGFKMNKHEIEDNEHDVLKGGLAEEHHGSDSNKASSSFSFDDMNYALHSALLILGRIMQRLLDGYDSLFAISEHDMVTLHKNLATHYRKKGNLAKAIESLKIVTDANPAALKGKLGLTLAEYFILNNSYDDAKLILRTYIKANPTSSEAMVLLGNIFLKENDIDNTIKCYEDSLKCNGKNHFVLFRLGTLYDKKKEHKKAIDLLKTAVTLAPEELKYHQHLGFIYESIGDHANAVPHFKKVMELEGEKMTHKVSG